MKRTRALGFLKTFGVHCSASRLLICGPLSILGLLPTTMGVRAQHRTGEWWVVVASFPSDPPQRQQGQLKEVARKARPCGLDAFNDDSRKFVGFQPGLNVFVLGPHTSKGQAERSQRNALRCFAGAYVKRGRHLGE